MGIDPRPPADIEYPETDRRPMGENTLQVDWIIMLFTGVDALLEADPNVFVAADLFWYPVEGNNRTVTAPDVPVAFGRPKGYRSSYRQWDVIVLQGFVRRRRRLEPVSRMHGWKSPRPGVRCDLWGDELQVWRPDNQRFEKPNEVPRAWQEAARRAQQERKRNEALAAKFRKLGINADDIAPGT